MEKDKIIQQITSMLEQPETTDQETFQQMENLKLIQKAIEATYKKLQASVLTTGIDEIPTQNGVFCYKERENIAITDKQAIISALGQKVYNNHSSITKTNLVKAVGRDGLEKLMDENIVSIKSVSSYYRFTQNK